MRGRSYNRRGRGWGIGGVRGYCCSHWHDKSIGTSVMVKGTTRDERSESEVVEGAVQVMRVVG